MEFLASYGSSSDEEGQSTSEQRKASSVKTGKRGRVDTSAQAVKKSRMLAKKMAAHGQRLPLDPRSFSAQIQKASICTTIAPVVAPDKNSSLALTFLKENSELTHNPLAVDLYAPTEGPTQPNVGVRMKGYDGKLVNAGVAEKTSVNVDSFEEMYKDYQNTAWKQKLLADDDAMDDGFGNAGNPWATEVTSGIQQCVPTDVEAHTLTKDQRKYRLGAAKYKAQLGEEYNFKQLNQDRNDKAQAMTFSKGEGPHVNWSRGITMDKCKTIFHGNSQRDYQGRPWNQPDSSLRPKEYEDWENEKCFIPKKCLHTWTGHTKGIWDVHNDRQCRRTYMGHSQGVRDISFSDDSTTFVSASMDRTAKRWDTETGQCIGDYTGNKIPYCITYYKYDNNSVLIGTSSQKIVQYDVRTGEVEQEYDHHTGPVHTITCFKPKGFVTTADDRSIIRWDYGVPVPVKHTSGDADLFSIPSMTLSPDGKHIMGQSLDNQIVTYSIPDIRKVKNIVYKGHINAGFACQVGFSPNGQFIMSGDGDGKLWFWDRKTRFVYRKLKAHNNGPCIGAIWHPTEKSKVATCGWDGLIKYWD
eukprot:GSMAST32.ASY1.ANO1.1564.1 assembled CDS